MPPDAITPLSGAGSNRKYFRLTGKRTLIGVCGTSKEENHAFICMAKHFRQKVSPYRKCMLYLPTG